MISLDRLKEMIAERTFNRTDKPSWLMTLDEYAVSLNGRVVEETHRHLEIQEWAAQRGESKEIVDALGRANDILLAEILGSSMFGGGRTRREKEVFSGRVKLYSRLRYLEETYKEEVLFETVCSIEPLDWNKTSDLTYVRSRHAREIRKAIRSGILSRDDYRLLHEAFHGSSERFFGESIIDEKREEFFPDR